MARPKKFKEEDVRLALKQAHGLKTGAAELLGCAFDTITAYCEEYVSCQEICNHWAKRRKDRAEYKLDEAIERGESWAVMFTLKNARDREYNERVDISGTVNPIKIITYNGYNYDAAITEIEARPDDNS